MKERKKERKSSAKINILAESNLPNLIVNTSRRPRHPPTNPALSALYPYHSTTAARRHRPISVIHHNTTTSKNSSGHQNGKRIEPLPPEPLCCLATRKKTSPGLCRRGCTWDLDRRFCFYRPTGRGLPISNYILN